MVQRNRPGSDGSWEALSDLTCAARTGRLRWSMNALLRWLMGGLLVFSLAGCDVGGGGGDDEDGGRVEENEDDD